MIFSSQIDFKPFARVWRDYEIALAKLKAPMWQEHYANGKWDNFLDYGENAPPVETIHIEVVPPNKIKPWMTPGPYDDDGIIRTERSPEIDAIGDVLDAADEWAELLQPLKNISSESIPECFYGSGLQEIRSTIYSSIRGTGEERSVSIAWTNECAAPLELLRLCSRRFQELSGDEKLLVIRAVAGWLSTKFRTRHDLARITDADFVSNVCLAIATPSVFPPAITEWKPGTQEEEQLFDSSNAHIISRTHAALFTSWCDEFFQRSFRDYENELIREQDRARKQTNYELLTDLKDFVDEEVQRSFVSLLDPSQVFETRAEVEWLTRGLSLEEKSLIALVADGYSLSEIARIMNVHKATVQSRLFRIQCTCHIRAGNH